MAEPAELAPGCAEGWSPGSTSLGCELAAGRSPRLPLPASRAEGASPSQASRPQARHQSCCCATEACSASLLLPQPCAPGGPATRDSVAAAPLLIDACAASVALCPGRALPALHLWARAGGGLGPEKVRVSTRAQVGSHRSVAKLPETPTLESAMAAPSRGHWGARDGVALTSHTLSSTSWVQRLTSPFSGLQSRCLAPTCVARGGPCGDGVWVPSHWS